ncbi:hypothetical protein V8C86DRAFT_2659438 [Haematococcus lacustris]
MLMTKAAKLQDTVTKAWQPGYLTLLPAKITWQPGGAPGSGTAKDVHIGLVSITNTQKAKGKPLLRVVSGATGYTFELGSELDRDALVEAYTKAKEQLLAPTPSANNTAGAQGSRSAAGAAAAPGVSGGSGGAAAVSSLVRQWEGRLPTPAQKRDMMKEDSELAERYNTLVAAAGVLAEDEFWAGVLEEQAKASQGGARQAGAEGDGAAGKTGRAATGVASLSLMTQGPVQRKGLSNAMFQVPVEQDGRSVSMRFTLTPDLIALVFAEKPHVKRAYERSVPHNMSEKEFWTRYLRHEMSKEERRKRLLGNDSERLGEAAVAAAMEAPPPEYAGLFGGGGSSQTTGDEDEEARQERRAKRQLLARSDPTVDLEANQADELCGGFGLLHASNKEPSQRGGLRAMGEDLARDINRHATVVLAGAKALEVAAAAPSARSASRSAGNGRTADNPELDELASQRLKQFALGLEDLQPSPPPQHEILTLKAPQSLFDSTRAAGHGMGTHSNQQAQVPQLHGEGALLSDEQAAVAAGAVQPNRLSRTPIAAAQAYEVLLEVCGLGVDISSQGGDGWGAAGTAGGGLALAPEAVLAPALLARFRTQIKMVADVARHFWACMPPSTPDKAEKAERLASHVDSKLWAEVEAAIATANKMGGPQRRYVKQLLTPAQNMMEKLLSRHQLERDRRRRA